MRQRCSRSQPADAVNFFFGGTCAHRVRFSGGRDLWLSPPQSTGPLDKLIFSHAERGGETVEPELSFRISGD